MAVLYHTGAGPHLFDDGPLQVDRGALLLVGGPHRLVVGLSETTTVAEQSENTLARQLVPFYGHVTLAVSRLCCS